MAKKNIKIKYLTKEELGAFLEAVKRTGSIRDRVMFGFVYAYGLRLSECLQLRLSDLNKDYSEVFVRRLKGGVDRHYYIEPKTARLLKRYLKKRGTWKNTKKNGIKIQNKLMAGSKPLLLLFFTNQKNNVKQGFSL